VLVRAMDRIFLLHADHEQNASTSTYAFAGLGREPVRLHRSRHRLALGRAHGGANEAALEMLEESGDV